MENKTPVFIFTSSEVQNFLDGYGVDLVALLQEQGVEVNWGMASDPATMDIAEKSATKVILLASSALVLALTPLLSQALQSVSPQGVIVEEVRYIPMTDKEGNLIKDPSGKPIMQWVKKEEFQGFSKQNHRVGIEGFGIKIGYDNHPSDTLPK